MKHNNGDVKAMLKGFAVKNRKLLLMLALLCVLYLVGEICVGNFFNLGQLLLTTKLAFPIIFFGLSQMIVIASGNNSLDLSVGYIATIVAILCGLVMDGRNEQIPICILYALLMGAVFGTMNGLLVSYANLPPLIVTMAMANIVQGIINVYTTSGFNITGTSAPLVTSLVTGSTGIIPNIVFLMIVTLIIVTVVMNRTRIGATLLSVGTNETAARLSGINVKAVRCIAFIVSGCLAGLTGILLLGNSAYAFKDMGSSYVMPSIAAVVVGGVSMNGGESNYLGVILGAVVLQSLVNLFVALGWGDAGKWVGYSIILLIMLAAYARDKRSK